MNTESESTKPLTEGIHHLGLTVPDLSKARDFFLTALGFSLVAEKPDYPAAFVSDGALMLTLWQAQTGAPTPFDRKTNLGLHHFALKLRSDQTLEQVAARLEEHEDVEIEFQPESLGKGPARHMMCVVAKGFRLEILETGS